MVDYGASSFIVDLGLRETILLLFRCDHNLSDLSFTECAWAASMCEGGSSEEEVR
jgi:hypothetical protein